MNNKRKKPKLSARPCPTPGCGRITLQELCERCRRTKADARIFGAPSTLTH